MNKQTNNGIKQYLLPKFLARRSQLYRAVQRLTDGSAVGREISPRLTNKERKWRQQKLHCYCQDKSLSREVVLFNLCNSSTDCFYFAILPASCSVPRVTARFPRNFRSKRVIKIVETPRYDHVVINRNKK